MRAVVIETFGAPEGLKAVEVPGPVPGAGQVLIRTEAIGVGGVDAMIRRGTLGPTYPPGMIPGSEVAGVVEAAGVDVDPAWIGTRVWAFTGTSGAYAEFTLANPSDIVALPDEVRAFDAVTIGSAGVVAHFALAHAHFSPGESVLVRGAAGSIGIAAVELAADRGASTIAVTTSSPQRGQRLRALGATQVLDRHGFDDSSEPGSFDVIIDIVGGSALPGFLDRLAPNGRLVLVGAVAGYPPADFSTSLLRAFQQSRSFSTFSLATVPVQERDRVRAAQLATAGLSGRPTPVIDDVLPLAHAAEAHRRMDSGTVFGRLVLDPGATP
ncbi:zinc-binding dehydrogenase [Amnibacterium kyonggiense]|uniref:NADPH2:quinone reductase n=1 Tax=Amnibacterium kyonggiense TaxID=595671 RepID=A0A4R7FQH7_9MICO|nr:zinc-binding dehydrogenase [Amnibacterium kyonggiense]TDS80037.1 NADPH2:quinone reductase [Amnibacterium kyonggiense]